jgi:hypothetical protein
MGGPQQGTEKDLEALGELFKCIWKARYIMDTPLRKEEECYACSLRVGNYVSLSVFFFSFLQSSLSGYVCTACGAQLANT